MIEKGLVYQKDYASDPLYIFEIFFKAKPIAYPISLMFAWIWVGLIASISLPVVAVDS
ncbi:MAG: hypothetical protein WA364_25940 [Candidatus Nitrosopolaris sp.]